MKTNVRRLALMGMLFALAIALSFLESMAAPLLGLPPGVKPGLANTVVLFALFCLSAKDALILVLLKAGFSFFTRGATAGLLSLAGGLCALGVMLLLSFLLKGKTSVLLASVCGALAHNGAQLAVICLLLGTGALVYAPVLVVSGVGAGLITAVLFKTLSPVFHRYWRNTTRPDGSGKL